MLTRPTPLHRMCIWDGNILNTNVNSMLINIYFKGKCILFTINNVVAKQGTNIWEGLAK